MVLTQLVKREIKAFLKNPAFIIMLVIIFVFYAAIGGIMRTSIEEAGRAVLETNIGVVLEEQTPLTTELVKSLNVTLNGRVKLYTSMREAVEETGIGILIPRGFTSNVTSDQPVVLINGMVKVDTISITRIQVKAGILTHLSTIIEEIIPFIVSSLYNQTLPSKPTVNIGGRALFNNKELNMDLLMGFLTFVTLMPVFVAILIGSNAGYAAQLVAFEKVEKAFEMLLAQPIKRSYIVIAKLIGASIATILFSIVYISGLLFLAFGSVPSDIGSAQPILANVVKEISDQLGIDISFHIILSIGISLIIGLLVSGSLGIILGSLAPDERTAGILITPITLIYFGVAFLFTFIGVQLDIASSLISGVTVISLPVIYTLSMISGETTYLVISLMVSLLTCATLIAMAVFLFNREIIILGLRIRFRRRE